MIELSLLLLQLLYGIPVPWFVVLACNVAALFIGHMFVDTDRSIEKTRSQVDEIVDWQREIVAENILLREAIARVNALCQHPRNKTVRIAAVREAMRPGNAILEGKK